MFMGSIKTSELKRLIIDEAKDDDKENAQIDNQPTRKISLGNLLGRILPVNNLPPIQYCYRKFYQENYTSIN